MRNSLMTAQLLGALLAAGLQVEHVGSDHRARNVLPEVPPKQKPQTGTKEIQRYRGMTDEQREWNAQVDARRRARKSKSVSPDKHA